MGFADRENNERSRLWRLGASLRDINYDVVADPKLPIVQAVRAAHNDSIIMGSQWLRTGDESTAVIDVTRLFTSDVLNSARSMGD